MITFWICLPLLAILLAVGVAVSLVQTLTSIQDPSFGAVPRLAALLVGILLCLPWMIRKWLDYTHQLLADLARYAR